MPNMGSKILPRRQRPFPLKYIYKFRKTTKYKIEKSLKCLNFPTFSTRPPESVKETERCMELRRYWDEVHFI